MTAEALQLENNILEFDYQSIDNQSDEISILIDMVKKW